MVLPLQCGAQVKTFKFCQFENAFFQYYFVKSDWKNAHGLLVSTKVDPKAVSLNPELLDCNSVFFAQCC
jgi:hypothetical protein